MATPDFFYEARYLPNTGECVLIPHPALPRHCRKATGHAKRRFETRAAALAARRDPNLAAYRCRSCGGFHLGHDRFRQPPRNDENHAANGS